MRHLGSVMSYFLEIVKEKGTNLYDSLSKVLSYYYPMHVK
jgi:hypothetical protein